ncbi:hypothetical protein Ddc_14824 [Ditylenchus destructor]|nr:hypothetical protein Ddc_14824 [Ditylenchus destructor]
MRFGHNAKKPPKNANLATEIIEIILTPGYTDLFICIARRSDARNWSHSQKKFHQLTDVVQTLGQGVRLRKATLLLQPKPVFKMVHLTKIQEISFLWTGGSFEIVPEYVHVEDADSMIDDAWSILSTPKVLTCRQLIISGFNFRLSEYVHTLFNIPYILVHRGRVNVSCEYLVEFIRYFFASDSHSIVFLTISMAEATSVLHAAFEEFQKARLPHCHIFAVEICDDHDHQFYLEDVQKDNSVTYETMQVMPMTAAESHNRFRVNLQGYPTFLIERIKKL